MLLWASERDMHVWWTYEKEGQVQNDAASAKGGMYKVLLQFSGVPGGLLPDYNFCNPSRSRRRIVLRVVLV